jgi:HEAT repeat protein
MNENTGELARYVRECLTCDIRTNLAILLNHSIESGRRILAMIAVTGSVEIDLDQKLALLFQCCADTDIDVRTSAISNLGSCRDTRAIAKLREFINDDDPAIQERAMHSLAGLGDLTIVDKCTSWISHGDPDQQESAIRLLAMLNSESLESLLEEVVFSSKNTEVRTTAAAMLARRGNAKGKDLLQIEIAQAQGPRRLEVACALARLQDQQGIDVLAAMVQNATVGGDLDPIFIRDVMRDFGLQ